MSEQHRHSDPAPPVCAVLLAAGASRRMGTPKQLLPVNGMPAVRYCAKTIAAAGIGDTIAVVGASNGDIVAEALAGMPVRLVRNPDSRSDMAGSLRAGLAAVAPAVKSVLICLADHPLVRSGTITALLAEFAVSPGSIIVPAYRDRRGHPTLFPRDVLQGISRGRTLRDLLAAHAGAVRTVSLDDPGIVLDMDTPADYDEVLRWTRENPPL